MDVKMTARISECGSYRYTLRRPPLQRYPSKGAALFLMLNPSTADAESDDATIRRCRAFARDWDCAGISVANLFALRSTDPRALLKHPDPVGPENDDWLRLLAWEFETVLCAWGARAPAHRVKQVVDIFLTNGSQRHRNFWCLGITKDGAPRHPLYVRSDQPMIPWMPPR